MAYHVRRTIRAAAVTDLTGLATTGSSVFNARVAPFTDSELPALNVVLDDETAEFGALGTFERTGRLVVEAYAQGNDGLRDTLDTIAGEVEAALEGGATLQPKLINFGAPTTQITIREPEGGVGRRTGILKILFPVTYRTAIGTPTALA